ncbi:hypothetical protein Goshw_001088 [Gossypium schwendimanii]|uniref:Uncharacterized protein n=1 Tax=Gossypium schwendimanii TaxID=34291 RepID=A0A7J9L759_GOSSC|nr:hypothetical protein [Gossypium schwendimanii]
MGLYLQRKKNKLAIQILLSLVVRKIHPQMKKPLLRIKYLYLLKRGLFLLLRQRKQIAVQILLMMMALLKKRILLQKQR